MAISTVVCVVGSIHCVEQIKKKSGSSSNFMCLRRVSRMAENRSQSSWPKLHCAQGLLEKSEELCMPHPVAWTARFPVSPEFISEEGIVGVKISSSSGNMNWVSCS